MGEGGELFCCRYWKTNHGFARIAGKMNRSPARAGGALSAVPEAPVGEGRLFAPECRKHSTKSAGNVRFFGCFTAQREQARSPQRDLLLRGDAVAVERRLLLQCGDDVLAVDRLLGPGIVQERIAFQLGVIAFANEGETEELQGFTDQRSGASAGCAGAGSR